MNVKTADSKGRISLGTDFANRTVMVERIGPNEVRITKARVIPEDEAWLWENDEAKQMVRQGLQEAGRRDFVDTPPDLDADACLLDEMMGD